MTYKECVKEIAKITSALDIADVTKKEAMEALKDVSFNDISEELWTYYCFASDIKSVLFEVGLIK